MFLCSGDYDKKEYNEVRFMGEGRDLSVCCLEKGIVQASKTGDMGTASWSLQLFSPPVLRAPNVDTNAFLLLSGARPGCCLVDLLGNNGATTRNGAGVGAGSIVVNIVFVFVSLTPVTGGTTNNTSLLLPLLNPTPFLIFLVMTTSGQLTRIFPFMLSSAKGCRDSKVAMEYT